MAPTPTMQKARTPLSSPFSLKAVVLLEDLNVPAYKIGSGDINNDQLIDSIIKKGDQFLFQVECLITRKQIIN